MASNFPPQLHLSLQPNTTNFKRSFEQFGVDVESPVGSADAGGSGNNGNDRNKRARSSSSFSEGGESTGSSTMASGSGSSSSSLSFSRGETGTTSGHPIVVLDTTMPLAPPRLPTPLIEDIDMADYVEEPQSSIPSLNTVQEQRPQQTADSYILSLERFHAFESEMSLLRQSPPSAVSAVRLSTPPPTLPPISISTSPSHTAIPIFQTQTEPFSDNLFVRLESPSTLGLVEDANNDVRGEQSTEEAPAVGFQNMLYRFQHRIPPQDNHYGTVSAEQDRAYDVANGFRDHLNSALERLRSASPLALSMGVTGSSLGSEEEEESENSTQSLDAQPPTLPPIPSVVADTEDDDWNDGVAFFGNNDTESPAATSGSASPSTTTTRWSGQWRRPVILNRRAAPLANPSLRDHPLPSPLLRDLHDWMDERERNSIASSLWMSSTDGEMGSRGEPEPSDTRNSSQDANPNPSSYAGSSAPGGEWDPLSFFSAEQATPASSSSTTVRSSSASTTVQRNQEERLIDQGTNDTSSETTSSTSSSSSSSSLFATPILVSHSRDLADQEVVRNLDHGVDTGLGFSGPRRISNLRSHLNERIVRYPSVATHNLAHAIAESRGEVSPNASAALFENNPTGDNDRSSRRLSLPRFLSQDLSRPLWPDVDAMFCASGNSAQHRENSPTRSPTTSLSQGGGEGSSFHDYMRQWLPSPASDLDLRGLHRRYPWTEREPERPDGPSYLLHHPSLPLRVRPSHIQPRPGTSTSLVAENAVEARRRADYVDLQRSNHLARGGIPGESTLESIGHNTTRNLPELEAYRRPYQNMEELFERGMDEPSMRSSARNPFRYNFQSSSHIQSLQGSLPNGGPTSYATSSAVDPSTPGSSIYPRRTLHRSYSGALLPLNLEDIAAGRTELNSPTGEEMFNFPAEYAASRSFRRDAQNTNTLNNISTVPTRNSWHSAPQRSREISRETTSTRYFLDGFSRPSNAMDMEGVINTSSAEPRRHSLISNHLIGVGRGSIREPFNYLDRNPENMRVPPSDAPSLPSPDLGGTFDAERQTQVITSASRSAQLSSLQNFHDLNSSQVNADTLSRGTPLAPIDTLAPQQLQNHREISGNQTRPSEVGRRLYAGYFGPGSPIENEEPNERGRNERRDSRNSALSIDDAQSGTAFESTSESTFNLRMQRNLLSASSHARAVREQMAYEQHQARMARQNRSNATSPNNGAPIVIDVEAFRPGPFRNTVQHLHDRSRQQNQRMSYNRQESSNPPTIPRLPFESDTPVGLRPETPPRISPGTLESEREAMLMRSMVNRGSTSFASARAASMNEHHRRQQDEIQSLIAARQARLSGAFAESISSQMGVSGDRRTRTERVHPDGVNILRPQYDMLQRLQPGHHGPPQNASTLARRMDVFAPWEVYREPLRANDGPPRDATAQNSARVRRGRLSRITPEAFSLRGNRTARAMGDFIRDEDFDGSYEGLVSLTQIIGDAKPKSTPSEILEKMEKAQYKEWATSDSDKRCPICLDDYGPTDTVLKLSNCSHWLHQDCLQQWLQTANTCPVCRKSVISSPTTPSRGLYSRHHHIHLRRWPQNARRGPPGPPRPGSGVTPDSNTNSAQPPDNEDNSSHDAPWRRPS